MKRRQKEGQFLYIALASHIPQNCFKFKGQAHHELECVTGSHKQLSLAQRGGAEAISN